MKYCSLYMVETNRGIARRALVGVCGDEVME